MQIEKICRACLREDDKMIDMFEKDVYQKFLLFANLTAEEIPDISSNLCQSCEQKLNISSLDFKEECQKSHEILLNYFKLNNTPHVDSEAIDADKKPSRLEQFSQYQVLEAIKDLKQNLYGNKSCIRCWFVGSNSRALSQHVSKMHKDLKPRWCYVCNEEFDILTDHVATNHSDDYTCKFCNRKFQSVTNLIEHLHNHSDVKPFPCSFCEKSFNRQSHLNLHLKKHSQMHDSEGNADKQPAALVRHQRTHTGERHVCPVCGRSFARSDKLKTHMMVHVGPKISCTMCSKKFCRPHLLRLHLLRHSGETPFVCAECGMGFIQRSHLVRHNKTHSDLRLYQCTYCDKSFKENTQLKRHMLIHSEDKPFKCNQCSYVCRDSSSLTRHMKQHVVDKPRADRPHVCLMCNSTFTTDAMLTYHINAHDVSFLEI